MELSTRRSSQSFSKIKRKRSSPLGGRICSNQVDFRLSRDAGESAQAASGELCNQLYPDSVSARVFVTHTRPEPILGTLPNLYQQVIGIPPPWALSMKEERSTVMECYLSIVVPGGHILAETARVLEPTFSSPITEVQKKYEFRRMSIAQK